MDIFVAISEAVQRVVTEASGGLGYAHTEAVYREALAVELRCSQLNLTVCTEVTAPVLYREVPVGACRADILVCAGDARVVVELKKSSATTDSASAQHKWAQQTEKYRTCVSATMCVLVVIGSDKASVYQCTARSR